MAGLDEHSDKSYEIHFNREFLDQLNKYSPAQEEPVYIHCL